MQKKHILIVDDDREFSAIISDRLAAEGFAVTTACSGAQALDLLAEKAFDLAVVDLHLQDMDGLEIVRSIKSSPELVMRTHVLILTADKDIHTRIAGFDLGTDDYLMKPLDIRELLSRVVNIFHKRHMLDLTIEEQNFRTLRNLAVTLCHEVNNPLVEISLKTQYMQDQLEKGHCDKDQFMELMADIMKRVRDIGDITKGLSEAVDNQTQEYIKGIDMLNIDRSTVNLEPRDLCSIIRGLLNRWEVILAHRRIHLEERYPEVHLLLWLDAEKIEKVLDIIVSTVIYRAGAGNSIAVNLENTQTALVLTIRHSCGPDDTEVSETARKLPISSSMVKTILRFHGTSLRYIRETGAHLYAISFPVEKRKAGPR